MNRPRRVQATRFRAARREAGRVRALGTLQAGLGQVNEPKVRC